MPFDRWSDRIAAAEDHDARRALMTEIGYWRATRLSDVPAQRDAAYAMATLHAKSAEMDAARREAESLVSLCQSPPEAREEELRAAVTFLTTLGGKSVVLPSRAPARAKGPRSERSERPERGPRADRADRPERGGQRDDRARGERPGARGVGDEAVAAAAAGRWHDALEALKHRRGPRAELVRAYVGLARALRDDDLDRRARQLFELEGRLRQRVLAGDEEEEGVAVPMPTRPERAERPEREPREARPSRRDDRDEKIDALEAEFRAPGADLDGIASRALDAHVAAEGERAPAPWLIGFVARALAWTDGARVRAAVEKHAAAGAYAATAYQEWPFERLVAALRLARERGFEFVALRRGVMSRGEPRDRKLWTLRLEKGGEPRMLVVSAPEAEDYRPDTAQRLADRVVELCPRTFVVAPGAGNASLREALAGRGVGVTESEEVGAAVDAVEAAAAVGPAPARAEEAAAPARPTSEERGRRERGGERGLEELRAALSSEARPGEPELAALVAGLSRSHKAFGVAREALAGLPSPEADLRLAMLLDAVHQVTPPHVRLSEGVTLAIRSAAAVQPSEAVKRIVAGPSAERFGGAGADVVVSLGAHLMKAGWAVDRVLRGPTGKERREDPVLEALGDAADGLWRMVVQHGAVEGEVWYLGDVRPEGRAAIPRLLQGDRRRVVVLPVDPDLLAWYATTRGPEAVGWSGDESLGDVLSELERWKA